MNNPTVRMRNILADFNALEAWSTMLFQTARANLPESALLRLPPRPQATAVAFERGYQTANGTKVDANRERMRHKRDRAVILTEEAVSDLYEKPPAKPEDFAGLGVSLQPVLDPADDIDKIMQGFRPDPDFKLTPEK